MILGATLFASVGVACGELYSSAQHENLHVQFAVRAESLADDVSAPFFIQQVLEISSYAFYDLSKGEQLRSITCTMIHPSLLSYSFL